MCTSFAAYFQKPVYGKNIDHSDMVLNLKLTKFKYISKNKVITIFHCQTRENNRFFDNVCMNSLGMFSNYQVLIPNNENKVIKPKNNRISAGNLFSQSQMYTDTVPELLNRMNGKNIYYSDLFGFQLHNMFADSKGQAVIIEASENGNEISYLQDKYIVMTNFPIYEYKGTHYSETHGEGSDRYKIAHAEIIKNKNNFGISQAFKTLKKARHKSKNCPTICSLVFDPIELFVYISVFGVFDKIWKISIMENYIETFSGFDKSIKLKIGTKGILTAELEKYMK